MNASKTRRGKRTQSARPSEPPGPGCSLGKGENLGRHRRILSLAPVLSYNRKAGGDFAFQAVCNNTGIEFDCAPGRLDGNPEFWPGCLHPEDAAPCREALDRVLAEGESVAQYRLRCRGGSYAWFTDRMALIRDAAGEPREIVGFLQDVTHTRDIEQDLREALVAAQAASQAKSHFLANMSHELRTPLNAVVGFSEVLLDQLFGELNPKQVEYVSTIRESGLRLLALLNDILLLARLDAEDDGLELVLASPADILRASLGLLREKAMRHGIALDLDLAPGVEQPVLVDEVKLRQVLAELVGNAVKFSPDGGAVRLAARREEDGDGARLVVRVEDSGPGIPEADADRLFAPFTQLEHPLTKKYEGTGLGLTLARRLARLMGGDVELVSGRPGCCFLVTLPLRSPASGAGQDNGEGEAASAKEHDHVER